MRTRFHFHCTLLLFILGPLSTAAQINMSASSTDGGGTTTTMLQKAIEKQTAVFIENRGQWDSRAKFLMRTAGLDVWITDRGVRYDLYQVNQSSEAKGTERWLSADEPHNTPEPIMRSGHVVDISFEGTSFTTAVRGNDVQPGYYNYLLGNDKSKWATHVQRYTGARINSLYNGIDAIFYLDEGRPRYDLVVAPKADPAQVRMKIAGSEKVSIAADGSLLIPTTMGTLEQRGLFAYQEVGGSRQQVQCRFVVGVDKQISFALGSYDRTKPLVIDPLVYSTFIGGTSIDKAFDIAIDKDGNAYITGITATSGSAANNFPTTTGAYQTTHRGVEDVFVTKLNSDGSALIYSTFIGGTASDQGNGITVDKDGNVYVTGQTASTGNAANNFPTTAGAYQTAHGGSNDVFVTKLNSTGSTLLYSTFIGGSFNEVAYGIAIDTTGAAYLAGYSTAVPIAGTRYPTTTGAYQTTFSATGEDAFVTKLNSTGSALVYSTLIGSTSGDHANAIAVDENGNAYVTGFSAKTSSVANDFPTTAGAAQTTNSGGEEVFVTKFNSTGSALIYSTFLGGTANDRGNGITVDKNGNVYVAGYTSDGTVDFPTTVSAVQTVHRGGTDAFVTKLNNTGTSLLFSTLLGGTSNDVVRDIAVDKDGNAYVTGETFSAGIAANNLPTTVGAVQTIHGGNYDVFLTKLNSTGSTLLYSTFLGGVFEDIPFGLAIDETGAAYLAGYSLAPVPLMLYPTTSGAYQTTVRGSNDAFVTKLFDEALRILDDSRLPVELTGFSLSASNNNIRLAWRTASEVENAGFEVQRAVGQDSIFTPIASYLSHPQLAGLGTSSAGKNYGLVDEVSGPGLYSYRLVDISTDGIRTIHEAKSIRIDNAGDITDITFLRLNALTPNPTAGELQVSYTLPQAMNVSMEIYTTDGRLVAIPVSAEQDEAGAHSQSIDVSGLAPGVYTLRLTAGHNSRIQQFIVVR